MRPVRGPGASNPFIAKLSRFIPFTARDLRTLDNMGAAVERLPARVDILSEGDTPRSAFVLMEGMACRYRLMADGRRQILTFLIPGDICELHTLLVPRLDHSIGTITPTRIARIEREDAAQLLAIHPRIAAALRWSALQSEAMLREHIVALGRRDARGRVAYLLCELLWRYIAVGMHDGPAIRLPLTQSEIADTLGLTPVHVNRVLQEFRRARFITLEQHRLTLRNRTALEEIAEVNQDYLMLGPAPSEVEAHIAELEREILSREHGGCE